MSFLSKWKGISVVFKTILFSFTFIWEEVCTCTHTGHGVKVGIRTTYLSSPHHVSSRSADLAAAPSPAELFLQLPLEHFKITVVFVF